MNGPAGLRNIQMRINLNEIGAHVRVVQDMNSIRIDPKPRVTCVELVSPPSS